MCLMNNNTVMEEWYGLMGPNTLEIMKKIKDMGSAHNTIQMDSYFIMENGVMQNQYHLETTYY